MSKLERLTYEETHSKGTARIRQDKLPELRHLLPGWRIIECEIRRAGVVDRNGRSLEFQDLRVYLTDEPPPLAPDTVAVEDGVS